MKIVTIKLPKNPAHNPHAKVTAPCAVSEVCTDSTGEHHSVIALDDEVETMREQYGHITRVEDVEADISAMGMLREGIRMVAEEIGIDPDTIDGPSLDALVDRTFGKALDLAQS